MTTALWVIAVCAVIWTLRMMLTEFITWCANHWGIPLFMPKPLGWLMKIFSGKF